MGSADRDVFAEDGEGPVRAVTVAPFRIAATAVSHGGLDQARHPWGDAPPTPDRAVIFRGEFPDRPTVAVGTAPVRSLAPHGHGLHHDVGNVREWTADRFAPHSPARALRGGSHLCHVSYCNRYRCSARTASSPDSSTGQYAIGDAREGGGPARQDRGHHLHTATR